MAKAICTQTQNGEKDTTIVWPLMAHQFFYICNEIISDTGRLADQADSWQALLKTIPGQAGAILFSLLKTYQATTILSNINMAPNKNEMPGKRKGAESLVK